MICCLKINSPQLPTAKSRNYFWKIWADSWKYSLQSYVRTVPFFFFWWSLTCSPFLDISWKAPSAALSWHRWVCCLWVVQAWSGKMQEGVLGEWEARWKLQAELSLLQTEDLTNQTSTLLALEADLDIQRSSREVMWLIQITQWVSLRIILISFSLCFVLLLIF